MSEDELIQIVDDEQAVTTKEPLVPKESGQLDKTWKIFIVDDDEQVHVVTKFVLADVPIFDRKIEFLHAYSAEESKQILIENPDIAVILLDVVMETDDAGLMLAKYIREEISYTEPRIILRTGQPGYAPELDVIKNYDINDYRTKSELTRNRLITAIIAAIRSYNQIKTISQSRAGLEKIVASAADLVERRAVEKFAEGVITQITSLLGLPTEGVLCARITTDTSRAGEYYEVAGAAGRYSEYINKTLEHIKEHQILDGIRECFAEKTNIFRANESILYIHSNQHAAVIYIAMSEELEDLDKQLLEAFLINISVAYENVKLFQRLKYIAFYDELTHLPNRHNFIGELDKIAGDTSKVVFVVDLDRFSDVNNSLGYSFGDQLLIAITERLQEKLPDDAIFTRVGPDQFGIIAQEQVTETVLERIFELPFQVEGKPLIVTVTIGCCRSEYFSKGTETLRRALIAVEKAKASSNHRAVYFEQNLEEQVQMRHSMLNDLKQAFDTNTLALWYQPQVNLADGRVTGFEALLRWPQEDGSFIAPMEFIPVAESSGLIVDIGYWVVEECVRFLEVLKQNGYGGIRGSVNTSIQQFKMNDFVSRVTDIVKKSGLPTEALSLEVTESMAVEQMSAVRAALTDLKAQGFCIAIDDFGTEFSSLANLKKVPFDHIKIDQSLMRNYNTPESQAVIEMTLLLAKKLSASTIAEGIETREQAEFIQDCGCSVGQGFLYSKALSPGAFLEYLKN